LTQAQSKGASQLWVETSEIVSPNKSSPLSCLSVVFCHSGKKLTLAHPLGPSKILLPGYTLASIEKPV
jgi:hypothetical protein